MKSLKAPINFLRKIEVPVNIALCWIVRIGTNREILLQHPLQDPLAFRWIVSARFHLLQEGLCMIFVALRIFPQIAQEVFSFQEMAQYDWKHESAVMSDTMTRVQGRDEGCHHFVFFEIVD